MRRGSNSRRRVVDERRGYWGKGKGADWLKQRSHFKRRRRGIFVAPQAKSIFKLRQERHLPGMANTYTQIYIHVVFAVEGRQNLIKLKHNNELQRYITGIVSKQEQKLIIINNMPDHLHMLVGLRPDSSLSDLIRDVKAGSSKFINEKHWMAGNSHGRKDLEPFHIHVRN